MIIIDGWNDKKINCYYYIRQMTARDSIFAPALSRNLIHNSDTITTGNNKSNISYVVLFTNVINKKLQEFDQQFNNILIKIPYDIPENYIKYLQSKEHFVPIYEFILDSYVNMNPKFNKIAFVYFHNYNTYVVPVTYNKNTITIGKIIPFPHYSVTKIKGMLENIIKKYTEEDLTDKILNDILDWFGGDDNDEYYFDDGGELPRDAVEQYLSTLANDIKKSCSVDMFLCNRFTSMFNKKLVINTFYSNKTYDNELSLDFNLRKEGSKYYLNDHVIIYEQSNTQYKCYDLYEDEYLINHLDIAQNIIYNKITKELLDQNLQNFMNNISSLTYNDLKKYITYDEYKNIHDVYNRITVKKHCNIIDPFINTIYVDNDTIKLDNRFNMDKYNYNLNYYIFSNIIKYYCIENPALISRIGYDNNYIKYLSKYFNINNVIYDYIYDTISYYFDEQLNLVNSNNITLVYSYHDIVYSVNVEIDIPAKNIYIKDFSPLNTLDAVNGKFIYVNVPHKKKNIDIYRNQETLNKFLFQSKNICPKSKYLDITFYGTRVETPINKNFWNIVVQ